MKMFALALTLAFGLVTPALAGGDGCEGCGGCDEGEKKTQLAKDEGCGGCAEEQGCGDMAAATKALDPIRNLAGEWESTDADKDGEPDVRVTYKVTAKGTAVVETIMPGTPHEMITVYTVDAQGALMLTHFCATGSQPRMKATKTEGQTTTFEFVDGTNCDPAKGFMGGLTMTISGETIKSSWNVLKDGKTVQTVSFELSKVKKAAK